MLIILQTAFPNQIQRIRNAAFPIFKDNVQAAFINMAKNLRDGESVDNAIQTFCKEILCDGQD